jgi:hypothetical protein
VAQNPWQAQPIQYLEFELVGVDAQERMTAQATGAARDLQIRTNQSAPFRLTLKTAGAEVRFDLYYNYHFYEELEMGATMGVLVAGPPMVSPRLLTQSQTFLVSIRQ